MSAEMEIEDDVAVRIARHPDVKIVLPGDILSEYLTTQHDKSSFASQPLKLGVGIKTIPSSSSSVSELVASVPGQLTVTKGGKTGQPTHIVDCSRKRYYPRTGDQVVGIIEDRGGDFYTVNIFSGQHCLLNRLSFDGATKRNKPELKRGDVIYARISSASRDMDTELSCLTTNGLKKDWSSGETLYGPLPLGLLLNVSTGYAKKLLRPDCVVMNTLGK